MDDTPQTAPVGRPPLPAEERRSKELRVQVKPAKHAQYDAFARAAGMRLSEWVRATLDAAVSEGQSS